MLSLLMFISFILQGVCTHWSQQVCMDLGLQVTLRDELSGPVVIRWASSFLHVNRTQCSEFVSETHAKLSALAVNFSQPRRIQ